MIYNLNQTASEQRRQPRREQPQLQEFPTTICVSCLLSYAKTIAQKVDVLIPANFIDEIEDFSRRNSITDACCCISCKTQVHQCCPACLKAHTMKKAKELHLNQRIINFLSGLIEEERGHNGYYLDEGNLVKL